jgi:hypothetical protein
MGSITRTELYIVLQSYWKSEVGCSKYCAVFCILLVQQLSDCVLKYLSAVYVRGRHKMRCVGAFLVLLCVSLCSAIPKELLYPYGTGTDQVLPQDQDEASSPEISLQVPIVFYGETYNSIYVSLHFFSLTLSPLMLHVLGLPPGGNPTTCDSCSAIDS